MGDNFEVLPLFPTPVLQTEVPTLYSKYIVDFYKEPLSDQSPLYGSRSIDSYILDNPKYIKFSNYILTIVSKFGNEILAFDYKSYKFTQSWISVKMPNESHNAHYHPNSLISGVFYFGKYTPETPGIKFHKYSTHPFFSPKKNFNNVNPYSSNETEIFITPGKLILFPSDLYHSVPFNTSNTPRYSLAFNVISPEGLGSEENLTELKFN